jgi:hypothetical protein
MMTRQAFTKLHGGLRLAHIGAAPPKPALGACCVELGREANPYGEPVFAAVPARERRAITPLGRAVPRARASEGMWSYSVPVTREARWPHIATKLTGLI